MSEFNETEFTTRAGDAIKALGLLEYNDHDTLNAIVQAVAKVFIAMLNEYVGALP